MLANADKVKTNVRNISKEASLSAQAIGLGQYRYESAIEL